MVADPHGGIGQVVAWRIFGIDLIGPAQPGGSETAIRNRAA
jgi:hypothetical protein